MHLLISVLPKNVLTLSGTRHDTSSAVPIPALRARTTLVLTDHLLCLAAGASTLQRRVNAPDPARKLSPGLGVASPMCHWRRMVNRPPTASGPPPPTPRTLTALPAASTLPCGPYARRSLAATTPALTCLGTLCGRYHSSRVLRAHMVRAHRVLTARAWMRLLLPVGGAVGGRRARSRTALGRC